MRAVPQPLPQSKLIAVCSSNLPLRERDFDTLKVTVATAQVLKSQLFRSNLNEFLGLHCRGVWPCRPRHRSQRRTGRSPRRRDTGCRATSNHVSQWSSTTSNATSSARPLDATCHPQQCGASRTAQRRLPPGAPSPAHAWRVSLPPAAASPATTAATSPAIRRGSSCRTGLWLLLPSVAAPAASNSVSYRPAQRPCRLEQRFLPPDAAAPAAHSNVSCRSTRRMGSCCPTPDALLAPYAGAHDCHPTGGALAARHNERLLPPQRNGSAQRLLAPCATRLGLERRWETPPDSMSAMTLTGTLPMRRNVNLGSSASCLRALETSRSSKLNCRI